jgi:hypothetical protein
MLLLVSMLVLGNMLVLVIMLCRVTGGELLSRGRFGLWLRMRRGLNPSRGQPSFARPVRV